MRNKGFTLIELIITIGIATILTGVAIFMLRTSFDSYSYGQKEILLEKILDDCLEEIGGGSFEVSGIKDALEILKVSPTSITFVPLWIDDSHDTASLNSGKPVTLNRPVKAGSSLPIAEVSGQFAKTQTWKTVPVTFISGPHRDLAEPDDQVFLNNPVDVDSKIRFVFQPDATNFSDCSMTIKWTGDKIMRIYKGKTGTILRHNMPGVKLTDFKIRYFDNTNTEIKPVKELISNITAVKLNLEAAETGTEHKLALKKEGFIFVNVRNTRAAGSGLIIQQGTRIKIPDSKNIRVFSLSNVSGIRKAGRIELEARPKKGIIWRVRIALGLDGDTPILRRYSVEYPPGRPLYSETIDLTADLPLNFLTLGGNGRYDYDFDSDSSNVVNLEGDVELVVTRMDATGATLFIRP